MADNYLRVRYNRSMEAYKAWRNSSTLLCVLLDARSLYNPNKKPSNSMSVREKNAMHKRLEEKFSWYKREK